MDEDNFGRLNDEVLDHSNDFIVFCMENSFSTPQRSLHCTSVLSVAYCFACDDTRVEECGTKAMIAAEARFGKTSLYALLLFGILWTRTTLIVSVMRC